MTDPIYGDRRCPTCQSIKVNAIDPCWYCNRNRPPQSAVEAAETIQRMMPDSLLGALVELTGPLLAKPPPPVELSELSALTGHAWSISQMQFLTRADGNKLERCVELTRRAIVELQDLRLRMNRIAGWKDMTADEFDAVIAGMLTR